MPRYFFHVCDEEMIADYIGNELSGPEEAKREAVRALKFAKALLPDHPLRPLYASPS